MLEKLAKISFLLLCLSLSGPGTGWGEVYHFIDREGVLHFTNVPTDPRYKRLMITEGAGRSGSYLTPGQLSLILKTIEKSAEHYHLEPALVKAIVKAESDFDPAAISPAGAMGLMQLMPSTAVRWSVDNPLNPEENIWGGVRYLRHLLDLFEGQLHLALAAYHAGEDRVRQHGDIPPIPATQEYVQKVLKYYKRYQGARATRTAIYKVTLPTGEVIYTDSPERYRPKNSIKSRSTVIR